MTIRFDSAKTDLMHEAAVGNLQRVRELIAQGADVNAVDHDGDTALYYAMGNQNGAVVFTLLRSGADPDLFGASGPVLHAAVMTDQTHSAAAAIAHGADVDLRTPAGVTAGMLAAGSGNVTALRLLHEQGADLNARDYDRDSVLFYAASRGQVAAVEFLLSVDVEPSPPLVGQLSPLAVAALLSTGLHPVPPGRSPGDYEQITIALLRAGADPGEMYANRCVLAHLRDGSPAVIHPLHVRNWIFEADLTVVAVSPQLADQLGI